MRSHAFYFNPPVGRPVLDLEVDLLLREVYSGAKGFLPREHAKPFMPFRIGRYSYYYDPWHVCFFEEKLSN